MAATTQTPSPTVVTVKVETAELRRSKIGIVFQQSDLLPSLTALDQLVVMRERGQGHGDQSLGVHTSCPVGSGKGSPSREL